MARPHLNDDSGSLADAIPHTPARRRYDCAAEQCPAPGTIFPGSTSGGGTGVCVYHYGASNSDWRRITQTLKDWDCVGYEVRECRRVMCDPNTACDPKAQNTLFASAWERLRPLVTGWEGELTPRIHEHYGDWGRRLDAFLGAQVVGQLRTQLGRRA